MVVRHLIAVSGALVLLPAALLSQITNAPGAPGAPGGQTAGTSFAGWNIQYQLPPGWQVAQSLGRLQMLASTSEAGAIFLAPGLYSTAQEAIADLSQFYQSLGLQAYPVEQPGETTIAGFRALTATYASTDQMGQSVQGRFICLFTPHGTGLNMLAMTTPQQMGGLRATLERLAAGVRATAPAVNQQAVAALAGQWILYSGAYSPSAGSMGGSSRSYEETVVFDGRGSYQWQSTGQVSVTADLNMGGAAGASQDSDQGTYTVIGNTLVLKGTKGQFAVDFEIQGGNRLVAAGKTYLRQ